MRDATGMRLHVRGIADKLGSPNRLAGDLVELVQKRCLHMEREGREHIYTITRQGFTHLARYEAEIAGDSLTSYARTVKVGSESRILKVGSKFAVELTGKLAEKLMTNRELLERAIELAKQHGATGIEFTIRRRLGGSDPGLVSD
jgi:hypothetical protein